MKTIDQLKAEWEAEKEAIKEENIDDMCRVTPHVVGIVAAVAIAILIIVGMTPPMH
jgi:hypothetical protein